MNDEDFVMGYAVGFNDGAQSGGGSGGEYSDIVIYRQYDFGSSVYGTAIPDFTKGNRFILPYSMYVYQPSNDLSTWKYGPVYSWEIFALSVCMTYNGQVMGMYTPGNPNAYFEYYTYENGVFKLTNEKFDPSVVSAEIYKNNSYIAAKIGFKRFENDSVNTLSMDVLGLDPYGHITFYYAPTGHGSDAFFRSWMIAFLKNGITGVCDPINPYAE